MYRASGYLFWLVFLLFGNISLSFSQDQVSAVVAKIYSAISEQGSSEHLGSEIQPLLDQVLWEMYSTPLGISVCRDLWKGEASNIEAQGASSDVAKALIANCLVSTLPVHSWVQSNNFAGRMSRPKKIKINFFPKNSNLTSSFHDDKNELKIFLPFVRNITVTSIPPSLEEAWKKNILYELSYYFFGIFLDGKSHLFLARDNKEYHSLFRGNGTADENISNVNYQIAANSFKNPGIASMAQLLRAEAVAEHIVDSLSSPNKISSIALKSEQTMDDCETKVEKAAKKIYPLMVYELIKDDLVLKWVLLIAYTLGGVERNLILLSIEEAKQYFLDSILKKSYPDQLTEFFNPASKVSDLYKEMNEIFETKIAIGKMVNFSWSRLQVEKENFCTYITTPRLVDSVDKIIFPVRPAP